MKLKFTAERARRLQQVQSKTGVKKSTLSLEMEKAEWQIESKINSGHLAESCCMIHLDRFHVKWVIMYLEELGYRIEYIPTGEDPSPVTVFWDNITI